MKREMSYLLLPFLCIICSARIRTYTRRLFEAVSERPCHPKIFCRYGFFVRVVKNPDNIISFKYIMCMYYTYITYLHYCSTDDWSHWLQSSVELKCRPALYCVMCYTNWHDFSHQRRTENEAPNFLLVSKVSYS